RTAARRAVQRLSCSTCTRDRRSERFLAAREHNESGSMFSCRKGLKGMKALLPALKLSKVEKSTDQNGFLAGGTRPGTADRITRATSSRTPHLAFLLFPQPRQHAVILEGRRIAGGLPAAGDVAEQPAHDLAGAGLGQGVGEANVVRPGQRTDFLDDV